MSGMKRWTLVAKWLLASLALVSSQSDPPCSFPEQIEHGVTDWDGKSSVAKYACFQGFHLVGPPFVECRYGNWFSDAAPSTYPTCKPIVCSYPKIPNGQLDTGDNVRYRTGQEASVECDEGYELRSGSSNGKIRCKEDGSWEAVGGQKDFPQCKEKLCQYPDSTIPVIENGSLEINGHRQSPNNGYKPGAVAVYHCHQGFVLLPLSADKRVCRKGKWEGVIPACVSSQIRPVPRRTHCPSPTSIPNGYYVTDTDAGTPLALPVSERGQYERGTIARYHCQEGYIMRTYQGQDTYRCMSTGDWSPKVPPVCIKLEQNTFQDPLDEVMCPSPTPIPNTDFERMEGWLTSNGAIHGTVLEYSCSIGYRDSRTPCLPTRRTCHAGKWVGNMPACVPFDFCERPPSVSHGFMVTSPENVYRIWTEVYYECHPGYKMKGSRSLKCHPTGCWTPNELPQCVREDLIDSGWSDSDSSSLPLVISLVTVSTGLAVIALFTTSCLVVLCRRKGGPVPPPSGPAHWSTTVTVTPECRPRTGPPNNNNNNSSSGSNDHMVRRPHEHDRMALIAFADGMQQVTLPSYEEALRDGVNINHCTTSAINAHFGTNEQLQQQPLAHNSSLPLTEAIEADGNSNPVSTTAIGSHILYTIPSSSHAASTNGGHYRQQGRYSRPTSAAAPAASSRSARTSSRQQQQHAGRSHSSREVVDLNEVHVWPQSNRQQPPRNGRRHAGSSVSSSGGSPRDHDALSDTVSHHSVSSAGVNWSGQRQPSQTASLRSGSAASVDVAGNLLHCKEPSESTLTTTESQTPSCRALAGSLASFDTSSIINTEGVPLLEEHELETEGSNSSEPGDTGSACTYSEASNKA